MAAYRRFILDDGPHEPLTPEEDAYVGYSAAVDAAVEWLADDFDRTLLARVERVLKGEAADDE